MWLGLQCAHEKEARFLTRQRRGSRRWSCSVLNWRDWPCCSTSKVAANEPQRLLLLRVLQQFHIKTVQSQLSQSTADRKHDKELMIMEILGRTYVKERAEGRDMKEIQSIEFPLWNNYVIYDELVGKHQRNAYPFHLNSGCHTDPGKHIHFLTRIIQLWWMFNHLQSSKFIYKTMLDIACHYLSIMEIRHLLLQLLHLRCPGHSIPVTSVSAEVAHGPPNCTTFTGWPCGGSVSEALKETPDVIRYDRVIRSMVMLDYHPTLEEWRTSKLLNLVCLYESDTVSGYLTLPDWQDISQQIVTGECLFLKTIMASG